MLSDTNLIVLNHAMDCLSQGDLTGAETAAKTALAASGERDGNALHVLGIVRMRQNLWDEAESLLSRAIQAKPRQPLLLLQLGQVLAMQYQPLKAVAVLSEAVGLNPDLAEAWYELANQQHQLGQISEAENAYKRALTLAPGHGPAKLGLGRALNILDRFGEAETILARGCSEEHHPDLTAAMLDQLLSAQTRQNRHEAALKTIARLQTLNPERLDLQAQKADLLLDLARFDEALALIRGMLARQPGSVKLHEQYNHVLYQLGRESELLTSYDQAPQTSEMQMSRALFVLTQQRGDEAEKLFSQILAREPDNLNALVSAAAALDVAGRHDAAMTICEKALARQPDDPRLHAQIASTALHQRDPEKAAAMLQKILAIIPHEIISLARMGTAWRMMGDERDESLMGYDELVRVFDLEPPTGYSSMAAFNEELAHYLGALHPPTREFLGQSLRGGTQTRRHLFGVGHELVERVKRRIDDALKRYIAELSFDPNHPLRARRAANFAFSGSWSSRLSDCGFHANHVHNMGWISSCYYAGLPEAVKDTQTKQGWIKFGEPDIDVGLSFRRAVQPVPGRLVLFPSYMWHGTIPFHDKAPRTTIAFDVIPA
jgi:tetratricopeptide (TPR) repeat protein